MTGKEEVITQKDVKAHQHVFRVYLWWPSSNVEKDFVVAWDHNYRWWVCCECNAGHISKIKTYSEIWGGRIMMSAFLWARTGHLVKIDGRIHGEKHSEILQYVSVC